MRKNEAQYDEKVRILSRRFTFVKAINIARSIALNDVFQNRAGQHCSSGVRPVSFSMLRRNCKPPNPVRAGLVCQGPYGLTRAGWKHVEKALVELQKSGLGIWQMITCRNRHGVDRGEQAALNTASDHDFLQSP
jgi:hypothetical protein